MCCVYCCRLLLLRCCIIAAAIPAAVAACIAISAALHQSCHQCGRQDDCEWRGRLLLLCCAIVLLRDAAEGSAGLRMGVGRTDIRIFTQLGKHTAHC